MPKVACTVAPAVTYMRPTRAMTLMLAALTLFALTPVMLPAAEAQPWPICVKSVCVNEPCTRLLGCPPDPWCNPTYCVNCAVLGCPPDIWCNQFYCFYDPPCTYLLGCPVDPWCNPTYCILL